MFFDIKLNNAVFVFQQSFGKNAGKGVYPYKPCCVAENNIVLGVNNACEQFDIKTDEPVNQALIKCADLFIEKPDYKSINKGSLLFMKICSDFGQATFLSFDEILIEKEKLNKSEIHFFTNSVKERISEELEIQSDVTVFENYDKPVNKYTQSAAFCDGVFDFLAAKTAFKLKLDNCCAKLFSLKITDKSGIEHIFDKRVAAPCGDFEIINVVLKTIFESKIDADTLTLSLFDIEFLPKENNLAPDKTDVQLKSSRKKAWDYVKENKKLTEIINKNGLYIYEKLCNYLETNPLNMAFDELCALAEKANTRRLKLGSYYINRLYAEKFVKECSALYKQGLQILINGYCPFGLLFILEEYCKADFYYSSLDDRTLNIINILKKVSDYGKINLKPAQNKKYDLIISKSAKTPYKSNDLIIITKKSFFSSDEKEQIKNSAIKEIYDFAENGFIGVFEQYAAIVINCAATPYETKVMSLDNGFSVIQKQNYITASDFPCWILYRNEYFDSIYSKLQFNLFDVVGCNSIKQRDYSADGNICVISASCIDNNGQVKINKDCRYVKPSVIEKYSVSDYIERDDIFFASKQSSVLKIGKKPKGCVPNSSTVFLVPKENVEITNEDLNYFVSSEFKNFYDTALNHQGFVLSSDSLSQYFLGKIK